MAQVSSYRRDFRSEEEFAKDIAEGHRTEREIINRFAKKLERKHGRPIEIIDNGSDNSGVLLDEKKVSTAADFVVDGRLVEVKFSKKNLRGSFHFKVSQIKSYVKQGAYLLYVNGTDDIQTMFTLFKPEQMKVWLDTMESVPFQGYGGKPSYKLFVSDYTWGVF